MLLWFILAALTAGVLAALLRPLMMASAATAFDAAEEGRDLAVYRDQLTEIEADVARGLIGADEAENARREVARRMIAHDQAAHAARSGAGQAGRFAGLAVAGAIPVMAIGAYLALGTPSLPGRPHGSVAPSVEMEKAPIDDLIAKVEARLKANPEDGQGWEVIAPVYFRMQRFDEAAAAFANAARLLGETSQRLAGFAEATVMANGGEVTDEARATYEKLAVLQPDRVEPKFWLALAKEQRGQTADAIAAYKALLASAPADAPWRPLVEERMAGLGKPEGAAPSAAKAPTDISPSKGPTAADVKAAESLSEKDRAQMVAGMVDGLAKRLQANPQDPRGWQQLVQSYVVLGQMDKAKTALADAQRHLAGNADALGELAALGKRLGL